MTGSRTGGEQTFVVNDGSVTPGAASTTPDPELAEGTKVGRYVVLERLGEGGMGVVVRAYDPRLRREIALKVMRSSTRFGGSDAQARMLREAQALAQLSDPHVVAVYDAEDTEHGVCIAMEYVEGRTLRDWLREQSRRWPVILGVVLAAARGLAAAHEAGIVHRDVKPTNVLVGDDGRVLLTDFGLAREHEGASVRRIPQPDDDPSGESLARFTNFGTVLGTPAYMAPEQYARGFADARSDQYALCVMLWEALYGQRPFHVANAAALLEAKRRGPALRRSSSVPQWLHTVMVRGLAPHPGKRWPSVDALVDALASGQTRIRRRCAVGGFGLVACVALAGVIWQRWDRARRVEACERAGASIAELWNDGARDRLRAALVGTGVSHAQVTSDKVMPWIDAQAGAWQTARTEACLDAEVHGTWDADLLERGVWCLDERRAELDALVTELSNVEATNVGQAVPAVAGLGSVASCRELDLLRRAPSLPRERRDEVRSVRAELSKATALQQIGAYDEGLEVARNVLSRAQALDWPPLVAQAHLALGRLLERVGDYAQAEASIEAAYFEATQAGVPEVALGAAVQLVYTVGYRLGRHGDALRWSRHAEITLVSLPDLARLQEANHLNNLAVVHAVAESWEDAKAGHQRALAIRERALGPEHLKVASSLNNLAVVQVSMGEYAEAKVLHERAQAIWEKVLGPEHPRVAASLSNLANAHYGTDSYGEAKALHERALAIWEKALGPDHPDVAGSLNNLADVHEATGSYAEARILHERALAIWEKALGPDHPVVALSLNNLANVHSALGSYAEAEAMHRRALAIREQAFGPEHPVLAASLVNLGNVALAQGRAGDAVGLVERAVKLREAAKSSPVDIAQAHFALARALWESNQERSRAIEFANQARAAFRDSDSTELVEVDAWLAQHADVP